MYHLITCVSLSYQIYVGLQIALVNRNGSKSYWDIINTAKMETLICSICKTIPCFLLLRVVLFPSYLPSISLSAETSSARFCLQAWAHSRTFVIMNRWSHLMNTLLVVFFLNCSMCETTLADLFQLFCRGVLVSS